MKNKILYPGFSTLCLLTSLVLIIGITLVNDSAYADAQKESLTRVDSQGGVWVNLTYLNPQEDMDKKELTFKVGMDTHSVDLDGYDFTEILVLRDDKGNIYKALGTEGLKGGGHHRGGIVKFPGMNKDGKGILQGGKYFEILVKGVAGVPERVLRWNLPLE